MFLAMNFNTFFISMWRAATGSAVGVFLISFHSHLSHLKQELPSHTHAVCESYARFN